MAWVLSDIEALEKAIATGATRVKYADKEVEYRSLDEMLRTLKMIKDELGLNGTDPQNNGRRYGQFSKGLL